MKRAMDLAGRDNMDSNDDEDEWMNSQVFLYEYSLHVVIIFMRSKTFFTRSNECNSNVMS